MSNEVAATTPAVPDLVQTPATTIGFEDIAPPTLYVAQRTSSAVDTGAVKYGDLFIAQGKDDPEPQVLRTYEPENGEGVLFIPLHMIKKWTHSDGENLTSWAYGDTGQPPAEAVALSEKTGKPVFRTYNYVVFVPEYDTEMPVNFRLNSRSQRPAANAINITVSRNTGKWVDSAFRVTTLKKESGANKWAIPVVTKAKATAAQHKAADALLQLILPGLRQREARAVSEPSI